MFGDEEESEDEDFNVSHANREKRKRTCKKENLAVNLENAVGVEACSLQSCSPSTAAVGVKSEERPPKAVSASKKTGILDKGSDKVSTVRQFKGLLPELKVAEFAKMKGLSVQTVSSWIVAYDTGAFDEKLSTEDIDFEMRFLNTRIQTLQRLKEGHGTSC